MAKRFPSIRQGAEYLGHGESTQFLRMYIERPRPPDVILTRKTFIARKHAIGVEKIAKEPRAAVDGKQHGETYRSLIGSFVWVDQTRFDTALPIATCYRI